MMKKIMSLFFCAAMMFSLSACGSKVSDEALDAFEKAIVNIVDMKTADYTLGMDTDTDGEKIKLNLDGSYDVSSAEPKINMVIGIEQGKEKLDNYMSFYVNGDAMYLNMMNVMKQKTSITTMLGQKIPNLTVDKKNMKIAKDDLKKVLKEASLKGETLTLKFDSKKLKEVAEKKDKTASNTLKDTDINNLSLVLELKNDMITSANMNFDMTKTQDKKKTTAKVTVKLTLKNVNKIKGVVFPDFSDYKEAKANTTPSIN